MLFLALVFILTILVVPTAPARALTFPQFGDSIHDYGIDLDGNHLYDELRIDFTATVQENGTYGFEAQLGNENFPYLLHDAFHKTLAAGTHTFTFAFLGPYLRRPVPTARMWLGSAGWRTRDRWHGTGRRSRMRPPPMMRRPSILRGRYSPTQSQIRVETRTAMACSTRSSCGHPPRRRRTSS